MDKSLFKHKTQVRVRNYEVDWQGIVHNATYLLYFEVGRIEYLKHIGVKIDLTSIQSESRVVLVRNEIDYKSPVRFDELLDVYSRISSIRKTSFVFEGTIEEATTKRLVAENIAVHVWLAPNSSDPMRISEDFRSSVRGFEKENLKILA